MTDVSMTAARPWRSGTKTIGILPALALLLCTSLLVALEIPSKPFLDKNSFYLTSSGFKVQVANDPAAKKAMHALPPHRFVVHRYGNDVRYLYAEPNHCSCIFIGTQSAYDSYRGMLASPVDNPDFVSPDYKTQAGALLAARPVGIDTIGDNTLAPYFQAYHY